VGQPSSDAQLRFKAHVVQYVVFMYDETKPCSKMDFLRSLPFNIPFFGPQFLPPLYAVLGKCQTSTVKPELAYLKPVNVVHPFYYPMLAKCPESQSLDVKWDGWMGTGSCKVYGVK
jgi:hypothetical protein